MVVERLSGTDLEALAAREVFGPLGMAHSSFRYDASAPVAMPHDFLGTAWSCSPTAAMPEYSTP